MIVNMNLMRGEDRQEGISTHPGLWSIGRNNSEDMGGQDTNRLVPLNNQYSQLYKLKMQTLCF